MLSALLLSAATLVQDSGPAYSGREHRLAVAIPRFDTSVVIDGVLDEAVWARAARLTGFSQYQPVDGLPAEEPTEILVWYGPDAIYFGVKATERHGDVVRATRANRDNIGSEDQIQILLDTYNDRRRAFLFGVNPLGVQQDGTRSDQFGGGAGGRFTGGGGVGNMNPLEGNVDLNPDYVFDSRGRLVPGGYEVEIRIPFKSLRYQEGAVQTWGINVLRRIQHSGFQDSWAPAVRANASFIGQSGTLEGLHDLQRGLVLELTPTATQRIDGTPDTAGWAYNPWSELGGDVRWGITQNLSLNGTYQPDFSQVEADVGQVLLNERFALFYPEKRPFFLDGLEQFDTPNQLIYTRQIANPDGGVKLAGKAGGMNVGALFAADNHSESGNGAGERPLFGILRLRRDVGRSSNLGLVATAREDGPDYSRLGGFDVRLYHSRLYFVELQAVQSWSRDSAGTVRGPLFEAMWDRTGRSWGFNYSVRAIAPDFRAAAGFVNRTNIIDGEIFNRFTWYGAPDALVQTYGAFVTVSRLWDYRDPAGSIEGNEALRPQATLRGGWQVGGSLVHSFFSFAPADYAGYEVVTTLPPDTLPFTVPDPERGLWTSSLNAQTPTYRLFTAGVNVGAGEVPIFKEAAPGNERDVTATLDLRPTAGLRVTGQLAARTIDRQRDGSRYSSETIPRLKVEYQISRAVFVRFVGQYTARSLSALEDRSGNPILIGGVPQPASTSNEFRMDWLFSYRPVPGTLVYLGYGSTLTEPDAFQFNNLQRTTDGFFGKVSWLFRL